MQRSDAREPDSLVVLRALRPVAVDLVGPLRGVGQDDHLVVAHLGEAARHREVTLLAADAVRQLAHPQRGEERRVTREHAEVALAAGQHDLVHRLRHGQAGRRGDLEREPVGH